LFARLLRHRVGQRNFSFTVWANDGAGIHIDDSQLSMQVDTAVRASRYDCRSDRHKQGFKFFSDEFFAFHDEIFEPIEFP